MAAFLAVVLLLAAGPLVNGQNSAGPDSDEYAIYTLIVNELNATDDYVVINDHTTTGTKFGGPVKERLRLASKQVRGGISPALRNDFETKNRSRYQLEDHFNLKVKTVFLTQSELDELIGDEWTKYLEKYPGHGCIELSRVGFNAQRNRALIYAGTSGGPKSGTGFYVLLSKSNGKWVIDKKVFAWLS